MITEGLYQSGALRAFHGFSQRYELETDARDSRRLRRVRGAKYVILGYHRVGSGGVPFYCTLQQKVFAEQMQYIKRYYRVLSVKQMAEELKDAGARGQAVVVTFDDGYVGTFTEAFPLLQKYDIPATVYLTAGAIETGEIAWYDRIFLRFQRAGSYLRVALDTPREFHLTSYAARIDAAAEVVTYLRSVSDEQRLRWCAKFEQAIPLGAEDLRGAMMSWRQVRVMHKAGVSFGAHTMTHPVASRLRPEVLRQEVCESKRLIEDRIAGSVADFAFPFGKPQDCGTVGAPFLQPLGFRTALTTIVGVNTSGADAFRLRRMNIGGDCTVATFALALQSLFFSSWDEEAVATEA